MSQSAKLFTWLLHICLDSTPGKEVLVALYAYESRADGDLSFRKGDIMYLLDQRFVFPGLGLPAVETHTELLPILIYGIVFSNSDWWYVKHSKGGTGYVPRNFVAKQQTIESEE